MSFDFSSHRDNGSSLRTFCCLCLICVRQRTHAPRLVPLVAAYGCCWLLLVSACAMRVAANGHLIKLVCRDRDGLIVARIQRMEQKINENQPAFESAEIMIGSTPPAPRP
jgi:hypothetical protein